MAAEFIYGLHAVRQVIETDPLGVLSLWVQTGSERGAVHAIRKQAVASGISVMDTSKAKLDKMSRHGNHQGVVCKYRSTRPELTLDAMLEQATCPLLLILDGVEDPHNLGACLRTAGGVSADAVIVPRSRGVGLTGAVRKVASGAAEIVPLIQVANLARAMAEISDCGVQLLGCEAGTEHSIYDVDLRRPTGFVLGSEGKGLRRLTKEHCDAIVTIPMASVVASLNVSVAGGVCLYEALRQRHVARS